MSKQPPDADVVSIKTGRRVSPMKGRKQTEKQRIATTAGRAKRAAQEKADQEAKAKGVPLRSQMLLDGTITVEDLDDEELSRMRTRDRAGHFTGGTPRWPAHLARRMQRENISRALRKLDEALITSAETLVTLMKDESVKPEVRAKIALALQDRSIGKVPEKHVVGEGTWDETFEGIIRKVKRDREETG